ncbi:MAG: class IV adenylate cyclase [Phycisphaerae bacterium]
MNTERDWEAIREIEIKLRCPSHEPVRERLSTLQAVDLGLMWEWNEFFDTPDRQLSDRRIALRVRSIEHQADGHRESLITVKGGQPSDDIQNRPSIDLHAEPTELAAGLFLRLGYRRTGAFEKRRHSWMLDDVRVELDELPIYGLFIELEGPDEQRIAAVRSRLHLDSLPAERTSYHGMLMEYLAAHPEARGVLQFSDRHRRSGK